MAPSMMTGIRTGDGQWNWPCPGQGCLSWLWVITGVFLLRIKISGGWIFPDLTSIRKDHHPRIPMVGPGVRMVFGIHTYRNALHISIFPWKMLLRYLRITSNGGKVNQVPCGENEQPDHFRPVFAAIPPKVRIESVLNIEIRCLSMTGMLCSEKQQYK